MKYLISLFYLIFTSCGIVFMKLGGNSISLSFKEPIVFKIGSLTLIGLLFYIASFILWQRLVITFDLSYIVPIMTGITQIIILVASYYILKENISIQNIVGIVLIIIGICFIAIKK